MLGISRELEDLWNEGNDFPGYSIYRTKLGGNYPAQNPMKNTNHQISASPLDGVNNMPPRAINDASRVSKHYKQSWDA